MPCGDGSNRPMTIGLLNACTRSCCSTLPNAQAVSQILHVHTNTLKRWVQAFAAEGEDALLRMGYGHPIGWLTTDEQQLTTWLDADVRTTAEACAWCRTVRQGLHGQWDAQAAQTARLSLQQPTLIPAKADPEAQAAWVETYAEKGGLTRRGRVYFLDAAHLLHAAVPSQGWIKLNHTMQLRTNAGRNRLNVLGAYSPDDQSLISLDGRESCDAERVAQLLQKIRAANRRRLLVVLDNAPYNKAAPVTGRADIADRTALSAAHSPNLNLIERF